jgi:hypothetical protein
VDDLFEQGFKAVYLALGAHKGINLGIPGEKAKGVARASTFCREVNLTGNGRRGQKCGHHRRRQRGHRRGPLAPFAWAPRRQIIYRRTRAEMPAWEEEIQAAEAEGVRLTYLSAPQEVSDEDGRVTGLRCIRMEAGRTDSSGRRRPVPIPGSEYDLDIDQLIPAIGQRPDLSALENVEGLEFTRWGTTEVDPVTYATGREGVFAGGDLQTGPWVAIGAIAAGKEAAESMSATFDGRDMAADREPISKDDPATDRSPPMSRLRPAPKCRSCRWPIAGAISTRWNWAYEEAGQAEAQRCLNCGYCCECYQCVEACGAKGGHPGNPCLEQPEKLDLEVGSVILAPGFRALRSVPFDSYGYANIPT